MGAGARAGARVAVRVIRPAGARAPGAPQRSARPPRASFSARSPCRGSPRWPRRRRTCCRGGGSANFTCSCDEMWSGYDCSMKLCPGARRRCRGGRGGVGSGAIHVHADLVAKLVPALVVRIVGAAHAIEVELLHGEVQESCVGRYGRGAWGVELLVGRPPEPAPASCPPRGPLAGGGEEHLHLPQVCDHARLAHHVPRARVVLVAVDATQCHRAPVDAQPAAAHLDSA